jgi:Fe2+ or Zn2+ uptake regulation protein
LKTSAPHALRIAEIRKALQEKGTEVSFTSLRHALSQLETRNAAEEIGNTRTWRHTGSAS